jgi:hypothetical protein
MCYQIENGEPLAASSARRSKSNVAGTRKNKGLRKTDQHAPEQITET